MRSVCGLRVHPRYRESAETFTANSETSMHYRRIQGKMQAGR